MTVKKTNKKWSGEVTRHSHVLDLEPGIFTSNSPHAIAESLKHSAEASGNRKGTPFQSAMAMLNFQINRAGCNLSADQKRTLEKAKGELRTLFGRENQ